MSVYVWAVNFKTSKQRNTEKFEEKESPILAIGQNIIEKTWNLKLFAMTISIAKF